MSGAIPPHPIRLHGVVLSEAQGQLYLYFYLTVLYTHKTCQKMNVHEYSTCGIGQPVEK